jgi:hypothetical protein
MKIERNASRKEDTVSRGHVTGKKAEKKNSQRWYDAIQEEHLKRIEAEIATKQQAGTK